MSEPIEWVYQAGTGCAYCKDGLCQRMNQLMEEGYSQRKAAVIMAEESGGKWTERNIREMFRLLMAKDLATPAKPKRKPAPGAELDGGEEKEQVLEFAMIYAKMAVAQLESICSGHPDREEAFDYVINWIHKNR